MVKTNTFIWSDNWCIENSIAWFVDGINNILFRLDMNTSECSFIAELPDNAKNKFRLNPRCIKCGDDIFCFPDIGQYIWIYQLSASQFQKIRVNNPNNERLCVANFWQCGDKIFAVSIGLKQVIEIDILEKKIDAYYDLTESSEEKIALSTKVLDSIYSTSCVTNKIYQFNIETKSTAVHTIPNIRGGFRTICFDGENFWLSGYRKEIYVWNKESNTVRIINEFPHQFGIYNYQPNPDILLDCNIDLYETPAFVDSVVSEQCIWFIPFQTNKILFVNKNTYKVNVLEIDDEDETESSILANQMKHKYLLEWNGGNDRLILFSFKNSCILEIDTYMKRAERKAYTFTNECLQKLMLLFNDQGKLFLESNTIDREVFGQGISTNGFSRSVKICRNNGYSIYNRLR